MNNAELYQKSNIKQKKDALQVLEEYANKIKWKNDGDTIIDIGSGDGGVTAVILKKFLPFNYKKVVGCDISENMVRYANEHYEGDRISFMVLDIGGEMPGELKGNFDHAFSFYALHWVKEQQKAFSNIYKLLATEGDCLFIFLGRAPTYDCFRSLARTTRWGHLLKDVEQYIPPYQDCPNPEKEIKEMMASIGFSEIDVKCADKSFVYSLEEFKRTVAGINPFKIPDEMLEDFLEEYVSNFRDLHPNDDGNNDKQDNVKVNYCLITVYGIK